MIGQSSTEMIPETLSGAQSLHEPAQQPSVYRERCVRDAVFVSSQSSSSLSIDIILAGYEPGLPLNPLLSPTVHRLKLLAELHPALFLRVNG